MRFDPDCSDDYDEQLEEAMEAVANVLGGAPIPPLSTMYFGYPQVRVAALDAERVAMTSSEDAS